MNHQRRKILGNKVRFISFCVRLFWNFNPSKAWNFNPSNAWKQLFVFVFRRVEISSFRRVEIKRKNRWFKLLNQKDFNPIVPLVEKRPTTITQLFFVENLPPITRCNIPLIETPEWQTKKHNWSDIWPFLLRDRTVNRYY